MTELKRVISLPLLVFYGLGNILGAGIYVLIGEIAGISGIYVPLSFLIASMVVLFTALSYAELSSRFPFSAGEAVYIYEGFSSRTLSTLIGLLIALSGMLSSATILHGFFGYLVQYMDLPESLVVGVLLFILAAVAVWGIGESVKAAAVLTLFETAGLLLIIAVGFDHLSFDATLLERFTPPLDASLLHATILGAFLAFYAFIGFEDMVNIAQEVKAPEKTMPKAIIIVLGISTLLYALVAIVSMSVLSVETLAQSSAPLADVYEAATGKGAFLISLIGMVAVLNGALIQIIMVSRILYGMSAKGWMPSWLGSIHPKTATPINATMVTAIVIFLLTLLLPILTLAQSTSFLILIIFTLVNVALIRIKIKTPKVSGVKTYPLFIPIIAIILNMLMLGFQLLSLF